MNPGSRIAERGSNIRVNEHPFGNIRYGDKGKGSVASLVGLSPAIVPRFAFPGTRLRVSRFAFVRYPFPIVPRFAIRDARCAFTLLEVLVALALLSIAGGVVFQLFSIATRGIARSEDYVNAEVRAEARMREILDRQVQVPAAWSEETRDGYRIDVTVSDALQERTRELPVKLSQVAITIHWKRSMAERSITLRTLRTVQRKI